MKKLSLFALLATGAAASFSAPKPKLTLLFRLQGHVVQDGPWATGNGRRIYYVQDTSQLYFYDRVSRKSTHVYGPLTGRTKDGKSFVEVSRAGDRLTYVRAGEDGDGPHLWTIALDTATGVPASAPKRVSLLRAKLSAISPDGKSIAFGN